jgi:ribosomal-protein-alanine N-acetyltransferase
MWHDETMIRRFERQDLDQVLRIEAQAFPKSSYAPEVFRHYHHVSPDTFLVFQEIEDVIAYIIFKTDGHVISLAVDPVHRRRGIGTRLMKACESCCAGKRLLVEVRPGNVAAQEFYRHLGFCLTSRIRLYYGTEDAFVMEKTVPKTLTGERASTQ